MRRILPLLTLAPLLACAEAGTKAPAADPRPMQEAACSAAIAAHVGRPPAEVTSHWLSAADGVASVEARDGNRRHLCTVDAGGRVLGYTHPR